MTSDKKLVGYVFQRFAYNHNATREEKERQKKMENEHAQKMLMLVAQQSGYDVALYIEKNEAERAVLRREREKKALEKCQNVKPWCPEELESAEQETVTPRTISAFRALENLKSQKIIAKPKAIPYSPTGRVTKQNSRHAVSEFSGLKSHWNLESYWRSAVFFTGASTTLLTDSYEAQQMRKYCYRALLEAGATIPMERSFLHYLALQQQTPLPATPKASRRRAFRYL